MKSAEREPGVTGLEPEGTRPDAWDWRMLDETLRPRLVRTGLKFGFRREEAEDLVQDVLQSVWAKRSRARNPEGYLVSMFYNRCRDRIERRAREAEVHAQTFGDASFVDSGLADRIHAAQTLEGAFRIVGRSCRALIEAYCVMRKTLAETAAETGSSVSTTCKRINSCLKRMRLCLAR
jgi:RNA polymerase sigma factor (sigma-70 family)